MSFKIPINNSEKGHSAKLILLLLVLNDFDTFVPLLKDFYYSTQLCKAL